ncbi:MAG: M48 family metallopeptidase [Planctomycetaceae bacterium]
MSAAPRARTVRHSFGSLGDIVAPALWMFLVPAVGLLVFRSAEADLDRRAAARAEESIKRDAGRDADDLREGLRWIRENPLSALLADADPRAQAIVEGVSATTRAYYASLRWLARIAWMCIATAAGLVVLVALSIPLSAISRDWQYASLLVGWHAIRTFMTLEVVAQGILCVGLSFWITALLGNAYFPQLIAIAAIMVGLVIAAVLSGVFIRVDTTQTVDGDVLVPSEAPRFWNELRRVATAVGTTPPEQVILGIDDAFFVTEGAITVRDRRLSGRTLSLSLPLLETLSGAEAEAILAHELAHFSGDDTVHALRVSPLLMRFDRYLEALNQSALTLPLFSFTLFVRRLFELSLRKSCREREFRADQVAAATVSPAAAGDALVRTVAYSAYRDGVLQDLFDAETTHGELDIGRRLAEGFRDYAATFADTPAAATLLGEPEADPFTSHPSPAERLAALGRPGDPAAIRPILAAAPDGAWHAMIPDAAAREARMWERYERRFRDVHERSLVYRYLPEGPEETAVVAAAFPAVTIAARGKTMATIDHEKVGHEAWPEPVRFDAVRQIAVIREWGTPLLEFILADGTRRRLPMHRTEALQQRLMLTVGAYWQRQAMAAAYHEDRAGRADAIADDADHDSPGPGDDGDAAA